jgi:ABC-type bacteriocin/lantibiotic exporter with double-glycine peptidase domain
MLKGGDWMFHKKLTMYRQTTFSDCGLCCIAMIGDYYGFTKPIAYYRNLFRTGRDGISATELTLLLSKINLEVLAYQVKMLNEFTFKKEPYILYTKQNHFVVFIPTNKGFQLYDPSLGRRQCTLADLQQMNGGILFESHPNDAFIKNKEKSDYFRHVKMFFSDVWVMFILLLFVSLGAYLVSILMPLLLEQIMSTLAENKGIHAVEWIGNIGLSILAYFIFYYVQNTLTVRLQKQLNNNITVHTINHLLQLPFSYFDNRGEENILYRVGLLPKITEVIGQTFIQAILSFVGIVAVSMYTVYRFPVLAFVLVFVISFLGIGILLFNSYMLAQKQDELVKHADVNAVQTEIVTMILHIKSSRLNRYFTRQFQLLFDSYNFKSAENKSKMYLFNLMLNVYALLVPLIGVLYVSDKFGVSAGEVIFIYTILGMILSNCMSFFTALIDIIMVKPLLLYLNDIYDERAQSQTGSVKINQFEKLEVNNVSFKYNDTGNDVLSDITLKMGKGEKMAIVGVSGSGKTTLIKLLSGLYDTYGGTIKINGIELDQIDESFFLKHIAIVTQQVTIFNKTLKENITLGDTSISDECVWSALKMVNLLDVATALPMQLNTIINNKGGNFSGGQAQRVALARAIVRNPTLMILDEATSSLDSLNEKIIYDNLKTSGVSILSISHRLSTIKDADNIYVIDNGRIVESGLHEQLIQNNALYKNIYTTQ